MVECIKRALQKKKKKGTNGHSPESCPHTGCYACQKFKTSHYSKNCPNKESSAAKQTSSDNSQNKTGPGKTVKRLGKPASDKQNGMKRVPL